MHDLNGHEYTFKVVNLDEFSISNPSDSSVRRGTNGYFEDSDIVKEFVTNVHPLGRKVGKKFLCNQEVQRRS